MAVNWYPPPQTVSWWDAVDVIGVDAYWPLKGTTVAALEREWRPVLDMLQALSAAVRRPVVFTELGFPVGSGLRNFTPSPRDYQLQADQYEAVFRATRVAVEAIDLRRHAGVHPRIGAARP